MVANLYASLVNVVSSQGSAHSLHDEVANFVRQEHERFGAFRRRMDFLSDSAGALGLMGTVWGMFEVFFQGASDKEVILRGMGIALITTLLGIVVSLILNLGSTELSSFFSRSVDRLERHAGTLRFRLMELYARNAEPSHDASKIAVPSTSDPSTSQRSELSEMVLRFEGLEGDVIAGQRLDGLSVFLSNTEGQPAAGVPVHLAFSNGTGLVDAANRRKVVTNDSGRASAAWITPKKAGRYQLNANLADAPAIHVSQEIVAVAADPENFVVRGDNQAAVAGTETPLPVSVEVRDSFGNPVSGLPVRFEIESGGGRILDGGNVRVELTDEKGKASARIVLGLNPGANVVNAVPAESQTELKFTLFGTASS
jgi:hypothetical protein